MPTMLCKQKSISRNDVDVLLSFLSWPQTNEKQVQLCSLRMTATRVGRP